MIFRRFRNIRSCHKPIAIASYACRRSRPGSASVSGAKLPKTILRSGARATLWRLLSRWISEFSESFRIFRKFPIGNHTAIASMVVEQSHGSLLKLGNGYRRVPVGQDMPKLIFRRFQNFLKHSEIFGNNRKFCSTVSTKPM